MQHNAAPHERILQKELAKDITIRVHSEEDYNSAIRLNVAEGGSAVLALVEFLELPRQPEGEHDAPDDEQDVVDLHGLLRCSRQWWEKR